MATRRVENAGGDSGCSVTSAADRLAEAALSVVSPPERAAAAVGDLLELAPRRGQLWFWASILRTGLAAVWQHFRTAPILLMFYAALALAGYLLVCLLLLMALAPTVVALSVIADAIDVTGHRMLGEEAAALLQTAVQPLIAFVFAPYVSGHRIASLWHERAVAFTMALVGGIVIMAFAAFVAAPGRSMHVPMLQLLSIVPFMVAGVVRQRLITLRRSDALAAD